MPSTFYADAVLFDMDGTLTDSIAAVEAAWGKVAQDIGQDPEYVIAVTHGKRAIDNLAEFKPLLKEHEMDDEVARFEETILFYADAYRLHGPSTPANTTVNSPDLFSPVNLGSPVAAPSGASTPALTHGTTTPSSRRPSVSNTQHAHRPSFGSRLFNLLVSSKSGEEKEELHERVVEEAIMEEEFIPLLGERVAREALKEAVLEAWQMEAAKVDRSVRILPGVRKLMDSIPGGRYAVATSGAKTYAFGCMSRVGIAPPAVTITADDKRLKAGKPAPDPFLLAAECLGYDPAKCVVFEDSPSGIRAGLASGATVVAVCTSHTRSKIEECGAHFVVENLESVECDVMDGRLRFTVQ